MTDSTATIQAPADSAPLDTLDAILDAAREQWRAWRATHPVHASQLTYSPEAETASEADYHECDRISEQLTPTDQAALLALAADPRVWDKAADSLEATIGALIRGVVRQCVYEVCDEIDVEGALALNARDLAGS